MVRNLSQRVYPELVYFQLLQWLKQLDLLFLNVQVLSRPNHRDGHNRSEVLISARSREVVGRQRKKDSMLSTIGD